MCHCDERETLTWKTWPHSSSRRGCTPSPASSNLGSSSLFSAITNDVRRPDTLVGVSTGLEASTSLQGLCTVSGSFSFSDPFFLSGSSKSIKQIAQVARLPASVTKGYSVCSQLSSQELFLPLDPLCPFSWDFLKDDKERKNVDRF